MGTEAHAKRLIFITALFNLQNAGFRADNVVEEVEEVTENLVNEMALQEHD